MENRKWHERDLFSLLGLMVMIDTARNQEVAGYEYFYSTRNTSNTRMY